MSKAPVPDLSGTVLPGTVFSVRVTPRAGRNAVAVKDGIIRVSVTTAPEGGKANSAVVRLLARALGVATTRLRLVRGHAGRDKQFVLERA